MNQDVAILLSGGVDSTSVAIAASKFAKSVTAYTLDYYPEMKCVQKDKLRAIQTASKLGLPIKVCKVDFSAYPSDRFKDYVDLMPMASGLTAGFDIMLQQISDDGIKCVLTGQNADWLYGLGATSQFAFSRVGLATLFRRIFLNQQYFSHVLAKSNRPKTSSYLSFLAFSFVEFVCASLYSIIKRKIFLPPKNPSELIHAYCSRPDLIVFVARDEISTIPRILAKNPNEIYRRLLEAVISKNMLLAESQIIKRSADMRGVTTVFPFSCESLIHFWFSKSPQLSDIFTHKKLIRSYVTSHLSDFDQPLFTSHDSQTLNGLEEQSWASVVLQSSSILSTLYKNSRLPSENITPFQKLTFSVSCLWLTIIKSIVKSLPLSTINAFYKF